MKEQFVKINTMSLIQDCSRAYGKAKECISNANDILTAMDGIIIDGDREHFFVFFLNTRRRIIKKELIFIGTENESLVSTKIIFKKALLCSASAIVCIHNHPSNEISPSEADLSSTKEIINAGKLLDVDVLDHLIIDSEATKYYSFREAGILSL